MVGSYWPDRVERITGVPVAQLYKAVQLIGRAGSAIVLTGRPRAAEQGQRQRAGVYQPGACAGPCRPARRRVRLSDRFDALEFLCVVDPFMSETASLADVVLPSTQWAEEEGTMTNLEGRVLLRRPAMAPPAGVWSDTQILAALGKRLGFGGHVVAEPRAIFDELRRASAGGPADYTGITYERIVAEDGVFWPCPNEEHPGTLACSSSPFPRPTVARVSIRSRTVRLPRSLMTPIPSG